MTSVINLRPHTRAERLPKIGISVASDTDDPVVCPNLIKYAEFILRIWIWIEYELDFVT